jgi:hypothetical protein
MKFHLAFRFVVLGLWAAPFAMSVKMDNGSNKTIHAVE